MVFPINQIPGGSAEKQYSCLGAAGAASLREFVAGGCGYVGICAGESSSNLNMQVKVQFIHR